MQRSIRYEGSAGISVFMILVSTFPVVAYCLVGRLFPLQVTTVERKRNEGGQAVPSPSPELERHRTLEVTAVSGKLTAPPRHL